MSLPSFPCPPNISRDEALDMILTSIAMEELALSHIINAEGEKLQYILGTLPGSNRPRACIPEILAVNSSINSMLDSVMHNQIFLKSKMEKVLEFFPRPPCLPPPPCPVPPEPYPPCPPSPCPKHPKPPHCPPKPPCPPVPPCPHDSCCPEPCKQNALFTGPPQGTRWTPGSGLPWSGCCWDSSICWNPGRPSLIRLAPGRRYFVNFTAVLDGCMSDPTLALTDKHSAQVLLRSDPCPSAGQMSFSGSGFVTACGPLCTSLVLEGCGRAYVRSASLRISEQD